MDGPAHPELIQAMLERGANLHVQDAYAKPPLVCAAGHPAGVRLLLEHGADVNAGTIAQVTALEIACTTGTLGSVRLLLDHGANVDAKHDGGVHLLYWAVNSSDSSPGDSAEIIAQLLAHGADPNRPTRYGNTVLEFAQQSNRPDIVALLQRAGAKK